MNAKENIKITGTDNGGFDQSGKDQPWVSETSVNIPTANTELVAVAAGALVAAAILAKSPEIGKRVITSRRSLLKGAGLTALLVSQSPLVVFAGQTDDKAKEEWDKEKASKNKSVPTDQSAPVPTDQSTGAPKPKPQEAAAPAAAPVTGSASREAQNNIVVSADLGHPMPTFSPDQLLKLTPDQIKKRATALQTGRVPNTLDVKFAHYSGEPAIFQRESFKWEGNEWLGDKHPHVRFADWAPWIDHQGLTAPHKVVGPKFDQFMKEAFPNIPTDLTGELIRNRERIIKETEEAGEDPTGTGHCYAQASFLALENEWRDGFYNPDMSSVRFTWQELGQLGVLMYSSRILMRDVNEDNFDPGTQARRDAIRHNVEWAMKQFLQGQPIVAEKPLGAPTATNWWSPVINVRSDLQQVTIGRFAAEPADPSIDLIRQAGRPIDPASAEAKDPSIVSHKSFLTFRDQSALSRYPSLEDNKRIARFLLWNESLS